MRLIAGILVIVLMMSGASANAGYGSDSHATMTVEKQVSEVSVLPCVDCDDATETCVRTACDMGIAPLTIRRIPMVVAHATPLAPATIKVSGLNPLPLSPPPKR